MHVFPLGSDGIRVTAGNFSEIPADVVAEIKGLGHGSVMAVLRSGFSNMVKDIRSLGINATGFDPIYRDLDSNECMLHLAKIKMSVPDEMLMNLCRIFFQQARENDPDADPREIAEDIQYKLDAYFSSVASAEQPDSNLCIIPGGKMLSLPRELQYVARNIPKKNQQSFEEWMKHYQQHCDEYYSPAHAARLPLDPQSANAIFSWNFLYPYALHIERISMCQAVFQEISRVLAPGGKIFIGPVTTKVGESLFIKELENAGCNMRSWRSKNSKVIVLQRIDERPQSTIFQSGNLLPLH